MALQGNLRDFSATEILQLLGMQQKTGCLVLERNAERLSIFVKEGRIVSTRVPGMPADDPLLRFLLKIHRLSSEQHLGLAAIHKESGRDLEDLLLNGRYLDVEELTSYLERRIQDDVTHVVLWDSGSYRFDPQHRWDLPVLIRLGVEGVLIEAARRVDEQRRFASHFSDPTVLLGVRDLPDPDEPLSEEERELFGIIDGRHTLAEVAAAAPLLESEAYEALDRMLQAGWIEFVGKREARVPSASPAVAPQAPAPIPGSGPVRRHSLTAELSLALTVALSVFALFQVGRMARSRIALQANDVFVTAQLRDVRYALELFRRETGRYPAKLDELVADRWVGSAQVRVPGHELSYRLVDGDREYQLTLERAR